MKRCSKCGETKPLTEFHKNSAQRDGLQNQCKPCKCASAREWRERTGYVPTRNPETYRAYQREWVQRNRYKRYGITEEQYLELLAGGCYACGSFDHLHIDHDHSCCPHSGSCGNCVRGALCRRCNHVLGHVADDADLLDRLALYLRMRVGRPRRPR